MNLLPKCSRWIWWAARNNWSCKIRRTFRFKKLSEPEQMNRISWSIGTSKEPHQPVLRITETPHVWNNNLLHDKDARLYWQPSVERQITVMKQEVCFLYIFNSAGQRSSLQISRRLPGLFSKKVKWGRAERPSDTVCSCSVTVCVCVCACTVCVHVQCVCTWKVMYSSCDLVVWLLYSPLRSSVTLRYSPVDSRESGGPGFTFMWRRQGAVSGWMCEWRVFGSRVGPGPVVEAQLLQD